MARTPEPVTPSPAAVYRSLLVLRRQLAKLSERLDRFQYVLEDGAVQPEQKKEDKLV